jgi:small-conductance mechanosensitive channel
MANTNLLDVFNSFLLSLYPVFLQSIINLTLALLVIVVGWLISQFFKLLVELVVENSKLEEVLRKTKLASYFEGFSFEEKASKVLGEAVFWFVFLLFLMTATDILGLKLVTSFLRDLLYFIPKAVTSAFVVLAGFVFGDLMKKILYGVFRGFEKRTADFASSIIKWSIVGFSFFTALNVLGIATELINTLLFGFMLFFGLAGGLAFGLGGQDLAKEVLENLRRKFR